MAGFNLFALAQETQAIPIPISVWPENELAYSVFARLATQWRVGMGGCTGLDYAAVLAFIQTLDLPRDQSGQLLADLQIMEGEALAAMADARD